MLGAKPDPHDVAILKLDVLAAVRQIAAELAAGTLAPRPLLVRGRPMADWISLDVLAHFLRGGPRPFEQADPGDSGVPF